MQKQSEALAVISDLSPGSLIPAKYTSDCVDITQLENIMGVLYMGNMSAGSTADFEMIQAQDAIGTGSKSVPGKAITQITQAGGGSQKIAVIELRQAEHLLDVANGFTFVGIELVIGTANSNASAMLLAMHPDYGPASDQNNADVVEVVS